MIEEMTEFAVTTANNTMKQDNPCSSSILNNLSPPNIGCGTNMMLNISPERTLNVENTEFMTFQRHKSSKIDNEV